MSKFEESLWNKFLKSGKIDDYLNYKFYIRKKEELENEANHPNRRYRTEGSRV